MLVDLTQHTADAAYGGSINADAATLPGVRWSFESADHRKNTHPVGRFNTRTSHLSSPCTCLPDSLPPSQLLRWFAHPLQAEHHGLFHKAPVQPITPPLLTADSPPPAVPPIVQMHHGLAGLWFAGNASSAATAGVCTDRLRRIWRAWSSRPWRPRIQDGPPAPALSAKRRMRTDGRTDGPDERADGRADAWSGANERTGADEVGPMSGASFGRPPQLHPDWPGYTYPPNELCLPPGCCPPRQYPPDRPHYPLCDECHWMWPNPEGWCRKVFGTSDDHPPFAPWVEMPCGTTDCDFLPPATPLVRRYVVAADCIYLFRDDADFAIFADAFDAVFTDSNGLDGGLTPRMVVSLPATKTCDVEAIYFGTDAWNASSDFDVPGDSGSLEFDSQLHSGEVNIRYNATPWLTLMHGARYIEFDEDLNYSLPLAGFAANFHFDTDNILWGYQIGADVGLVNILDRIQIVGVVKGGIYGNQADWARVSNVGGVISDFGNEFTTFASTLETEVTGTVRLSDHCALRGGYQMLWINGLALAMENLVAPNSADLLLMHGAFAGLEMRF